MSKGSFGKTDAIHFVLGIEVLIANQFLYGQSKYFAVS
jgi:hypothetical protein